MKNSVLLKAIKSSADPHRAKHFFDLLASTPAADALKKIAVGQARILAALFSGSQALGNLLLANPDWLLLLNAEPLKYPRREQGLRGEVDDFLKPLLVARDYDAAFSQIRRFKQREMLRIAARDLARLATVTDTTREISDIADTCLNGVWRICRQQFAERFSLPRHQDVKGRWHRTECCVLGMGKLGGQELNYSSDVDVLFVYGDEGQVFKEAPTANRTPRALMLNHQFFNRLAGAFIAEVSRTTPEGMLFRIDLRLRPEGDSGPLCRSLESYENYYAQWGQTWERMMLIKSRCVAGDKGMAAEFLEMIQPFRFPRAINQNVLREVGAMKDRIENEIVRAGELERNVKLGRGGIREIEFIAQSLQLLHAGRQPFLQGGQTLPTLEKLAQYDLLSVEDARALYAAYCFLRDVEHRLQMEENLQTHTIPQHRAAQERLAKLMGFPSREKFEAARQAHTNQVRQIFEKLLKAESPEEKTALSFPPEFAGAEIEWKRILSEHSFKDAEKAFRVLREFVEGPGYVHVSPRTIELARKLLPRLFALCPKQKSEAGNRKSKGGSGLRLSDPDRVVTRLDSFIAAYGAQATLLELWNSNPAIFELLLLLFDRSEFLAELAIRTPDLVDELVTSGRLRQRKSAEETLRDLRHGLNDDDQALWLRRYHQAELMRIGLRDILGLADPEQYLTELSSLADACLQYALEVAMRKNKIKAATFVIIGLGKFGGAEINYGSDLDIIVVTDAKPKNLPELQRVALEIMELISRRTHMGIVFHTDARLRPDGEKGLLVNTLDAYEAYYRQRAVLWEIQSLTRARPVAGDLKLGEQFQKLAAELTNFRSENVAAGFGLPADESQPPERKRTLQLAAAIARPGLAAYTPDWKKKIHQMRMRIEKERTPAGKEDLAIKTGKGGLMDAEFIAQTFCLAHGWQEPNTLRALERGRTAGLLPDAGKLIKNYRELRRVEGILRRWSYEGETVLPDDPAPFYRVSVRCGFTTPEAFRKAIARARQVIRVIFLKVFSAE